MIKALKKLDWKRLLNLRQDEVSGLDIGSSSVKMVQLHKNGAGWTVAAAGVVDIACDGGDDNNLKEINTVRAICDCLELTGIQTQLAVCGVCGPETAVRYFKFPLLPPDEILGAVRLEAEQVCPFGIDEGVVDYQLIPNGEDGVSGILVAATNKLIEKKSQLAKGARLNSVVMDVDGLALLNCFSECEQREAGRAIAILDVGNTYTNLAIVDDDDLPFIRDIVYAGEDIVNKIADENFLSRETVSRNLFGSEDSSEGQLELSDSLAGACKNLVVEVTETLRYYAAQKKSAPLKEVFLCGGFSSARGFAELLDNQLTVAVVSWNPFDKIGCEAEARSAGIRDTLRKNGHAMAVAAGLAMRQI
jgi:type IV pilus assembly protein PilM